MKKYLNDKFLWIGAGITIALTIVMFALNGIVFTNKIYAQADMYYQFIPFYEGIWDKAHEGGALFTWNMGGGMSIWYIMSYCFMSPFNILALICPRSFIPYMMNIIIALKMGTMAYTFSAAIKYFYKRSGMLPMAFGIGYAVSGYVLANMWNLMWFDALYLFPIVIVGLYRLVKYKKFLLFSISLGLTIISNYFVSVTVIITCIIVYVLLNICYKKKKEHFTNIPYFALSFALAIGIGAIIIIPQLFMYKYTLVADESIGSFKAMLPFSELIARHMMNSPSYVDSYWFPNIYMGVFFIPVLPLIFLRKIDLKKRICIGILLTLFIVSFIFTYPNFIWHGLHYTNSVMSRHSFMYIFFCLFFSFGVIANIKEYKKKHILIGIAVSAIYMIFMYKYGADKTTVTNYDIFQYSYRDLVINTVFIGIYIVFLLEKMNKVLFSILMIAEFVTNFYFVGFKPPSALVTNPLYSFSTVEVEEKYEVPKDGRSEYIGNEWNRGMEWNFPSVTSFSSASPMSFKQLELLGTNGCYDETTNQYSLNGATEILLDMFSIEHIIENKEVRDRNAWGFGFLAKSNDVYLTHDWIENQNNLFEAITGIDNVLIEVTNIIPEDGWLYSGYGRECEVNGISYQLSPYNITQIKEVKKGEKINGNGQFYLLSEEKRNEALDIVRSIDIEVFEDGYVKGTAPETGEYVFTTPIQPGWTAKVNGEKVNISTYADLFISVPLKEGDALELKYHTPGIPTGSGISIGTISGIIVYNLLKRKVKNHA